MVYTRKISADIRTFNAPSIFMLSMLVSALNADESFDSKISLLDPSHRSNLLCRLLSSNAAVN